MADSEQDIAVSRCLEGPEGLKYDSLESHVESKRFRAPRWVAWITVSIFCSLHLIVPSILAGLFGALVLCYRGRYVLDTIEWLLMEAMANFMPEIAWRTASSLLSTLDHYVISLESISHARQVFSCPDSNSAVCRICAAIHPEIIDSLLILAFLILMVYPSSKWHSFSRLFQAWYDIFNFSVAVDQSKCHEAIKSKRPFMFIVVPHGVIPLGCFLGISFVRDFLPAFDGTICAASIVLRLPILRQIFLWLGSGPADRSTIVSLLRRKQNVYLMSGGIAELFLSNRRKEQLFLQSRKGIIKLAQETNAILVPIYVFGHTRLFDQLAGGEGIAMLISRLVRGSITLFWGQMFLPIPHSTPLRVCLGDPLLLDWADPANTVDHAHALFVESVQTVYERHKVAAGYGDIPLTII